MKHSDYIEIAKELGKVNLKNALIGVVVKHIPFFASGPFNYILVKIATALAKELVEQAEMRIFFKYVDFRTDFQAREFEKAMIENHKAQKEGSEDDKIKAEAKLISSLNKLVSLSK